MSSVIDFSEAIALKQLWMVRAHEVVEGALEGADPGYLDVVEIAVDEQDT